MQSYLLGAFHAMRSELGNGLGLGKDLEAYAIRVVEENCKARTSILQATTLWPLNLRAGHFNAI